MRIHVLGPIAWDTVIEIDSLPSSGHFTHAKRTYGRAGGQGLNVACGLQSTGLEVSLHGYLGSDDSGVKLHNFLQSSGLNLEYIKQNQKVSPHVLVMVDETGERTMIGLAESFLKEVRLDFDEIQKNDIVVWPVWHPNFRDDLRRAKDLGARTVIGLRGVLDNEISSEYLITSEIEFAEKKYDPKFQEIFITHGASGASHVTSKEEHSMQAPEISAVDSTGAGDAFMAGVVYGIATGRTSREAMNIGVLWGSFAAENNSSIPPIFSELQLRFENEKVLFEGQN